MREMFAYVVHWPTLSHEVDCSNSFLCLRAVLGFSVIAEGISRNVALLVSPVAFEYACQLLLPSSCPVFSRYTP
jgi:hypothetical protein